MTYKTQIRPRTGATGLYRLVLTAIFAVFVAGCSAMQGVNVGANIPLGGLVNVGASTTIGDGQAPSNQPPSTNPPVRGESDESDETDTDSDSDSEDE
jgi:hypothetical protein